MFKAFVQPTDEREPEKAGAARFARQRQLPATVDGPEDRREGNEKARPLSSKELSGTWLGEKESVKVEITFRGTDDAKWQLNTISPNFVANIGADLKRVDDPQSDRVLLRFDYRSTSTGELGSAVIGLVDLGEADTLQLTILPKATEFVREQTCTRP
ncbi:MAG: hypothetical protein H8E44_07945 [Planctomycetes bacterium]|nr:hypothetical protein [Planctomycetota bacterium]MBL7043043.1 hypothetical protein [Pirellulaceae bacterium]